MKKPPQNECLLAFLLTALTVILLFRSVEYPNEIDGAAVLHKTYFIIIYLRIADYRLTWLAG